MNSEFLNELNACPNLKELKSKNPFRVPDGYFENMDYPLISFDKSKEDIPEGYFDHLPDKVIAQLDIPKEESRIRFLWPLVGAAAACLAFLIYYQTPTIDSFDSDETFAYVLENYESYEMDELLDLFEEEDLLLEDEIEFDDEIIINQFIDDLDDDELESLL